MAAKQGLTAQLSQAGEDAKRAVLSRTGVTSSWFSNLNTVCTIKSAPPRSPEVLQMLATKSGWLFKRNEQHVWQARWCCVVPHTFLYYFDANIVPGQAPPLHNPTPQQQEDWNKAVQTGYGNRKQHEKRSTLYLFNNNNNNNSTNDDATATAETPSGERYSSLQPSGIIDLECYSGVHRSTENKLVLELAGDDQVNPDLRNFYFCASNSQDSDEWTNALLHGRHAALLDECDAYKQVCEGFAQQLQSLHAELDQSTRVQEESQEELYRVRSTQEDLRRTCWRMVEEALEKPKPVLKTKRQEYLIELEGAKSQGLGIPDALKLLLEYTNDAEDAALDLTNQKSKIETHLKETGQSDQARVAELTEELDALRREMDEQKAQWKAKLDAVSSDYHKSQKELADVQKELSSTRMEITMYQSQQKSKVNELQQHKKILKKEVIDLRCKFEDAMSELSSLKHQQDTYRSKAEQEMQKSVLLERYVEKIESQVKVQQNMMEMMSQSGMGSVHGGASAHLGPTQQVVYIPRSRDSEDVADEGDDDVADNLEPVMARRPSTRRMMDDSDNKSHMSELTEDRTQRHFESYAQEYTPYNEPRQSPRVVQTRRSPKAPGPPSFIGVAGEEPSTTRRLETINSSAVSLPAGQTSSRTRPTDLPRSGRDNGSVTSETRGRLSIAQRARLEADRQSTPVRARLDEKTQLQVAKHGSRSQEVPPPPPVSKTDDPQRETPEPQRTGIWKRMELAMLGPSSDMYTSGDDDDDDSSIHSTRVTDYTDGAGDDVDRESLSEEKKVNDTSSVSNLSLQERSKLQREKQLRFLRDQGLIRDEAEIRGGAGASPARGDTGSVASTNASVPRSAVSFQGANSLRL